MNARFTRALRVGTERVAGWADLLDRINVFPVADGDTGRNLVLSLSPLLKQDLADPEQLAEQLLFSARGNSGNIAARFFSAFVREVAAAADPLAALRPSARRGNELAWQAVPDPKEGTILSFFAALAEALGDQPPQEAQRWAAPVLDRLERVVRESPDKLPRLAEARVVDAGALGMFIFFDGFLTVIEGHDVPFRSITEAFGEQLAVDASFDGTALEQARCCIDAVIDVGQPGGATDAALERLGDSVVAMRHSRYVKVHLHADDEHEARARLAELGEVVSWAADDLEDQRRRFLVSRSEPAIHVMTDAAGSVTSDDASILGFTLLDSYVNIGPRSFPETSLLPAELYRAMRDGVKVSTAQASDFEKHQHYEKVLALHERVLYLCVGSVFTGNYQTVMRWKAEHDPDDRMVVIDSGAASGRLGLVALATALHAHIDTDPAQVIAFAREAVEQCQELIFLDKLHYLAAGGRLSKTSAFFGDLLKMKPVVSPTPEGAKKVAVVRNQTDQLELALERLQQSVDPVVPFVALLEYTDNEEWVRLVVGAELARRFPSAEVLFQPMSLTSGSHMGPGTWAVAFLPQSNGIGALIERSRNLEGSSDRASARKGPTPGDEIPEGS